VLNYNREYTGGVSIGGTGTNPAGYELAVVGDTDVSGALRANSLISDAGVNYVYTAGGTGNTNSRLYSAPEGGAGNYWRFFVYGDGSSSTSRRGDMYILPYTNNSGTVVGSLYFDKSLGNIGVSDNTPTQRLDVSGTVAATSFVYRSDARLKENITPFTNSLSIVNDINPVRFDWREEAELEGSDVGVIAQQIKQLFPEAVKEDSDGTLSVDYVKLVVPLLGAVQQQQQHIESLEARIEELEK